MASGSSRGIKEDGDGRQARRFPRPTRSRQPLRGAAKNNSLVSSSGATSGDRGMIKTKSVWSPIDRKRDENPREINADRQEG